MSKRDRLARMFDDGCCDFFAMQKLFDDIKLDEAEKHGLPHIYLVLELRYVDGAQRVVQIDLAGLKIMTNVTDVRPPRGEWVKRETFIREKIELTKAMKRNPLYADEDRYLGVVG